jgi:tripartite-type tricarboxylate transporter receptor subunit TctC
MNRRQTIASIGATSLWGLSYANSHAAEPLTAASPLKMMVASAPGGTPDLLVRAFAQGIHEHFSIATSVHNVDGAAGEIALKRLQEAPADGSTWLLCHEAVIAINPNFYPRASLTVLDRIVPVARVATSHFYLVVRQEDSIQNLSDFVTAIKAQQLAYSTRGVGTLTHLCVEQLASLIGFKALHIPYRSGPATVQAVMSGDVRFTMAGTSALTQIASGRLRMLAVSAPKRLSAFPSVPSLAELIPGFEAQNWFGLFARHNVPEPLLNSMREKIRQLIANDTFRQAIEARALQSLAFVPTESFTPFILSENKRYTEIVKQLGLSAREGNQ